MKTILLLSLSGIALALSSCNTIAGVGDDITAGGRALNKAAVSTEEKMSN